MNNIIFVKTYAKDAAKVARLLESMTSVLATAFVVAEDEDFAAVSSRVCGVHGVGINRVRLAEWLPDAVHITDGYCRQQYVKLMLHKIVVPSAYRFFVTDSDCQFVGGRLYGELSQPETYINVAPLKLAKRYNISAVEAAACTREILCLDEDPAYDYTVYPFWPVDVTVLAALEGYLERMHDRPMWETFQDFWEKKKALSEMNIYGEFARRWYPNVHRLNDVTVEPTHVAYHFIRHNHYAPVRLTA